MRFLRRFRLIDRTGANSSDSFERYYGGVLRSGVGYPTASEARRDRQVRDFGAFPYGWPL